MPYVGGVRRYRKICAEEAERGYDGFIFATAPDA